MPLPWDSEEHPIRREHLRWAFLAIGALAFMDAYATWSGGIAAVGAKILVERLVG